MKQRRRLGELVCVMNSMHRFFYFPLVYWYELTPWFRRHMICTQICAAYISAILHWPSIFCRRLSSSTKPTKIEKEIILSSPSHKVMSRFQNSVTGFQTTSSVQAPGFTVKSSYFGNVPKYSELLPIRLIHINLKCRPFRTGIIAHAYYVMPCNVRANARVPNLAKMAHVFRGSDWFSQFMN